ncbi:AAA family ATPase [Pseudomonas sp. S75]|uniref:AAA family ATPase n=1 Tax=unclassified Pseudomonas TaxID=196821 RepID=UPI00190608EC|nr:MULTISPECIES: AAA family ATPase [unclassified Pseudomonas]MBJ9977049.1 AAA family ATPase [Pseudomonas sp. S30]MBK0153955.1 AAA family ATPase [Pseudomonas sp. S75]
MTSIEIRGQRLTLAKADSYNLFDIDSVSLIIGPNGSGKTQFIQKTIEKFWPGRHEHFESDCQLQFHHSNYYDKARLKRYGLIYYSPVRNQPILGRQGNLINVSNQRKHDLFELHHHRKILAEFDLSPQIFAELNVDIGKVGTALARLAIRRLLHSDDSPLHNLEYMKKLDLTVRRMTRDLQNIPVDTAEERKVSHIEKLTDMERKLDYLLGEAGKQISAHILSCTEPSPYKSIAIHATIQHMLKNKKFHEKDIINLLDMYSPNPFFKTRSFKPRLERLDNLSSVVEATADALNTLPFKEINAGRFRYRVKPHTDRDLFSSPQLTLFTICLPHMSSGQWAIVNQIISLHEGIRAHAEKGRRNLVLFLDEGDAYLHLAWQRKYIWQLNKFFTTCKEKFKLETLQLIIASHSPLLASDVPHDFICRLRPQRRGTIQTPAAQNDEVFLPESPPGQMPAFAAPLHAILNRSFGAVTIGEFAIRRINETIASIRKGMFTERDQYLMSVIDDPLITAELKRLLTMHQGSQS